MRVVARGVHSLSLTGPIMAWRRSSVALAQRRLATVACAGRTVNQPYRHGISAFEVPKVDEAKIIGSDPVPAADKEALLAQHGKEEWTTEDINSATEDHVLFTWGATGTVRDQAPLIQRTEGVYFYNEKGDKYLDFNSMAMCVNHGHTPDPSIVEAVVKQMNTNCYAYPGVFKVPMRARLSKLLSEISPGDINHFTFPSGGAEAIETAVRMARVMTGRQKIMTRYRSYHGSTTTALAMTGEQRRWSGEAGATGHVHFFDPFPYSFSMGETNEEKCERALTLLREQILFEGPHLVAAIVLESVTGTNGILKPPKGYLEGIRQMCDDYGILMICDEVMTGFGRTGKLYGFQHSNAIPDIITFAKGVNGAFIPLGGVGVRDHVAEHFQTHAVGIGSTYNSHPVALASAYAALKVMLRDDHIGNSYRMGAVMEREMNMLLARHPSVKAGRCLGLFGCIDIQKNLKGEFIAKVTDPPPPAMVEFRKRLIDNGVWTMMRGHAVNSNPPLISTEAQIKEGFAAFDKALEVTDAAMED